MADMTPDERQAIRDRIAGRRQRLEARLSEDPSLGDRVAEIEADIARTGEKIDELFTIMAEIAGVPAPGEPRRPALRLIRGERDAS
jgi:anti-sigma factor RsiW